MRTMSFEFENDTKYLILPNRDYTDADLDAAAVKALYWQIVIRDQKAQADRTAESQMTEAQNWPRQVVDGATLPADRYFRGALQAVDGKFTVDMDKARGIHLERIRKTRDAALAVLDIETIKATGKGDNEALAAVEAQKQVLRDLPQTIDLSVAVTPEELKAIWPEELK